MRRNLRQLRRFAACAWALGRTPRERWAIFWRLTKNLRVRLGLARYRPGEIYRLDTRYGAVHLRDNFGDVTNLPGLWHEEVYRVRQVDGDGVILDIGANIGLFAAWAAHHNPGRVIHCIEPLGANSAMVARNCPHAKVHQLGVGAAPGSVELAVDQHGTMASSVDRPLATTRERFQVLPLDELARLQGISEVAFLKMDTEGMELEIFAGGRETLRRTRRVAMETHGRERHRQVIEELTGLGFDIDAETFEGSTGMVYASRRVAA